MSLRGLRAQLSRPVALLVILAAVPSCSGLLGGKTVIREHRKFVVDDSIPLNASMPQLSEKPYPYKVAVERFEVSRWYDQDKVVFRLSQQELRDDSYLRWAHRPSDMITDAVVGYLRQAFLFADVRQEFLEEPDFTLTGTVKAIERIDSGDLWYARLSMSMLLVDRQGDQVWHEGFGLAVDDRVQVHNEDFVHTVSAINQMLRGYMVEAVRGIDLQMLIRKYIAQGRPIDQLEAAYHNGRAEPIADSLGIDSRLLIPHPDYEVIPGKPTP